MKNVKYSIRLLDEDEVIHNVLPSELQYVKQLNSLIYFHMFVLF